MKKVNFGLLPRVIVAIVTGLLLGGIAPLWVVRVFATFNSIFSEFLGFAIPLIIVGLVIPGIADLGSKAGRLLVVTVVIAYCSTLFSGFFTYFTCSAIFPQILEGATAGVAIENTAAGAPLPFFSIPIPPIFGVMTALVIAFVLGIGISAIKGQILKGVFQEFKNIIENLISRTIIPLLPFYIFGIFLTMSFSGAAFEIISLFSKVIGIIFILHVLLLVMQFMVAGFVSGRNPFRLLWNMLPAYMTALGTSSSAATIPVTLAQTKKNGVREDIADFCIPLCATIHLSGSVMKITAMSIAVCIMYGLPFDPMLYIGFIFMLSLMMVAAPGVPGGAIMAATGVLQSMLGFDGAAIGLMIALYIAIDSFGTACNVTGDGAIAIIMNKIAGKRR